MAQLRRFTHYPREFPEWMELGICSWCGGKVPEPFYQGREVVCSNHPICDECMGRYERIRQGKAGHWHYCTSCGADFVCSQEIEACGLGVNYDCHMCQATFIHLGRPYFDGTAWHGRRCACNNCRAEGREPLNFRDVVVTFEK